MKDTMRVTKTLVIGLGSTGTAICDRIVERIDWELGSITRAPWVKFLALETDSNRATPLQRSGDFRTLSISAYDFEQIVNQSENDEDKIRTKLWADRETLLKLPNQDVTGGAGNIRMVGRLAFLHEPNYFMVKQAVQERINLLRELPESVATEARGTLPNGSNPAISFGANSQLRVMVAGTLCGGTCSGLVSDFGLFLRTMLSEEEKIIGMFTLPRPDLTPAIEPRAERFKKNAYTALVELNHYHLSNRQYESAIKFADNVTAPLDRFPYDLPFLMMPKGVGTASEEELNGAIADRIFLNIFAPETDPFAKAVDATVFDRDHHAHVFCALGLSTVEFPAQRVTEACTKRLMAHALGRWQTRALPPESEKGRLAELGLSWPTVYSFMLTPERGMGLDAAVTRKLEETLSLARNKGSLEHARRNVDELRQAFAALPYAEGEGLLPPGSLYATVQTNRSRFPQYVLGRVQALAETRLSDYNDGLAPFRQTLARAQSYLLELSKAPTPSVAGLADEVDELLEKLTQAHGKWVGRDKAVSSLLLSLSDVLNNEMRARMQASVIGALQTASDGYSSPIERVMTLLKPVQKRLENLNTRVTTFVAQLNARANDLARNAPTLNGLAIFESETTLEGTVRQEYETCLRNLAVNSAETFEELRERAAATVISAWPSLGSSVAAFDTPPAQDLLLQDFYPNKSPLVIPRDWEAALERAALQPFLNLSGVDVLSKWRRGDVPESAALLEVKGAAEKARPFLSINKNLAERGGRSPIQVRRVVLAPKSPFGADFQRGVGTVFSPTSTAFGESPNPYRALMLEEWYRFPLSGVTSVLGTNGLHEVENSDFPTFHTRRDVYWTSLSERDSEMIEHAEELTVVAMLLNLLEPRGGALVMKWPSSGFGMPAERRLPLNVSGAVRMLAMGERDLNNVPMTNALVRLEDAAQGQVRGGKEGHAAFLRLLQERLERYNYSALSGWPGAVSGIPPIQWAGEALLRYFARDEALFAAYLSEFPPDPQAIGKLRFSKGQMGPWGSEVTEDGLYCPIDGGFIGRNEQEATLNGWRCYIRPDEHYYGPE